MVGGNLRDVDAEAVLEQLIPTVTCLVGYDVIPTLQGNGIKETSY